MGTTGVPVAHYRVALNKTVFEAAQERAAYIFDNYDTPIVFFSGGKDSTCAMNVFRLEALRRGRILDVAMFDEEIMDPDTVKYCEEVANYEGVRFHWFCLPIRHTLRSDKQGHWFTWDPDYKDLWARPLPPNAITELPGWTKDKFHFDQLIRLRWPASEYGSVCQISAVRTQESFNRERVILFSGTYIHPRGPNIWYAKPIYDWKVEDVWLYIRQNNLSYSGLYDKMRMVGRSLNKQRIGPWGNVAASSDSWQWAEFYPDMWEKAITRLPALKGMARYGRTKLYKKGNDKPPGLTWQEWTFRCVDSLRDDGDRAYWINQIRRDILRWDTKHSIPFPEEPVRVDGRREARSWKKLAQIVAKNDRISGESRDRM